MNRSQLQTVSLLSGCLLFIGATRAQLAVQNNLTPNELVNSILVGQGVTVSNVTFNGQPANTIHDQIGSFAGTSNLGLANGVVLATGQVPEVVGPNMNTSLTVPPAFPVNTPCLLYTSDAADERSSVDLGGRRIIKKKNAA